MKVDYEKMTVSCEKCENNGYIIERDDKDIFKLKCVDCECLKIRNYLSKLKKLNIGDNALKKTFDTYIISEEWQKETIIKAKNFIKNGVLFYIGGQVGSGKTHICTAIINEFLKNGKDCSYMVWDDIVTRLKQTTYGDETKYNNMLKELKNIEVLYIDDFFKKPPTDEDRNKAFQVINTRYSYSSGKITIISGERTINELLQIDEAIASRMFEMAEKGKFIISIDKDIKKNYRLKSI